MSSYEGVTRTWRKIIGNSKTRAVLFTSCTLSVLSCCCFILDRILLPMNIAKQTPKVIIFWTKWFEASFPYYPEECTASIPDYPCTFTNDRQLLNISNAVMFHHWDMNWRDIPDQTERRLEQLYVYYNLESSANTQNVKLYIPHFYNWTMTHYLGSDVGVPYGFVVKNTSFDGKNNYRSSLNAKTLPIAWFVSNCKTHAKREQFVERLKEKIQTDIYGRCGNLSCEKLKLEDCRIMIAKKYWFYLSFENSVCVDYTTEKFWMMLKHDIVPIVLKRSILQRFAPPHSFIAVDDFLTMDKFVDYLNYLMKNTSAYVQYFAWKKQGYTVHHHSTKNYPNDLCALCYALWTKNVKSKSYGDIGSWYTDGMKCIASYGENLLA